MEGVVTFIIHSIFLKHSEIICIQHIRFARDCWTHCLWNTFTHSLFFFRCTHCARHDRNFWRHRNYSQLVSPSCCCRRDTAGCGFDLRMIFNAHFHLLLTPPILSLLLLSLQLEDVRFQAHIYLSMCRIRFRQRLPVLLNTSQPPAASSHSGTVLENCCCGNSIRNTTLNTHHQHHRQHIQNTHTFLWILEIP